GVRDWGSRKGVNFIDKDVFNVMFLDLKDIEQNKKYELKSIPVEITPGFVHRIYLSFKFSAELVGPFFDTLFEENHWGGFVVEFYASKFLPPGQKYLKMKLNNNQLIDEPTLENEA
nr:hypothetical protein [Bdellovibrionales bacterium]